MPETDPYLVPKSPADKVRGIAQQSGVAPDIADDYLKVTHIESGQNQGVGTSSKGAKGFGQVMPDVKGGTIRTVGNRKYDLTDEAQNIEAGLRYFNEGGSDPVGRRLHYFGGPKARQHYEKTGQIPNISDGNMTASQYVQATGGKQSPQDPYLVPKSTSPTTVVSTDDPYLVAKPDAPPGAAMASLATTPQPQVPVKQSQQNSGLTTNDPAWHFGMSEAEWNGLSRAQKRKAMPVLTEAATEDQRKKSLGQEIQQPSVQYQNSMRAKARLPLKSLAEKYYNGADAENKPVGGNPLMPRVDRTEAFAKDEARKQAEAELANKTRLGIGLAAPTGFELLPKSAQEWLGSALAQGTGDLTNLTAGIVRSLPSDPFDSGTKSAADKINRVGNEISTGAQIMDRQAARGKLSQTAKDVLGGTIGSSPVYALMALGVPPPVAFGLHSYLMQRGQDADLLDTLTETTKAATIGALFELPVPAKVGVLSEIGRRLSKAGIVGGGTELLNTIQGKDSHADALVNALFAATGGVERPEAAPPAPEQPNAVVPAPSEGGVSVPQDKITVYRGSTGIEDASRSGVTFYSPSKEYASKYGPNVKSTELDTSNFFDTRKPEHQAILDAINDERRGDNPVALVHPTDRVPFYNDESNLRHALRDRGYNFDGMVVTDWTSRGSGGIVYAKYPKAVVAPQEAPRAAETKPIPQTPVEAAPKTEALSVRQPSEVANVPEMVSLRPINKTQAQVEFTRREGQVSDEELRSLFPDYDLSIRRVRPFSGGKSVQGVELTFWEKSGTKQVPVPEDLAQRFGLKSAFGRQEEPQLTAQIETSRVSEPQPTPRVGETAPEQKERAFPKTLESTGREGGTDRVYEVVGDKQAVSAADARITADPESARQFALSGEAKPDTPQGKERIATALRLSDRLINEAESSADKVEGATKYAQAIELNTKASVDLTEAGQTAQAGSLARKYTPQGVTLDVVRIAKAQGKTPKVEDIRFMRDRAKKDSEFESRLSDLQKQIDAIKTQGKSSPKVSAPKKAKIPSLIDRFAQMESEAKQRISERQAKIESGELKFFSAGATPTPHLNDYITIGAAKIARGGLNFASWSAEMIKDFGEGIKPHLNKIFMAAHKMVSDEKVSNRQASETRAATKAGKSLEDFKQERYEVQVAKRQNRLDMDRKFNELEKRENRTKTAKGLEIGQSIFRDSLLQLHGYFNILAGLTTKQAADLVARIPSSMADIAQVRKAQLLGRPIPRTTTGISLGALKTSAGYLARKGVGNIKAGLGERPSEVMPKTWPGPFDSPLANAAIAPMGKLYLTKEVTVRSAVYPHERYNQAAVMAKNDVLDGVIKRSEQSARIQDYLNGRASIEGGRNQQLAESMAGVASEYEVRSGNPTEQGKLTKGAEAKRVSDMMKDPSLLIDSLALRRADKQVYADPSLFASAIEGAKSKVGNISPATAKGMDIAQTTFMPFVTRPVRALSDFLYTYTGTRVSVETIKNTFKDNGGSWTPAERASFNDALGRGATGLAGMYALGYALGKRGIITPQNDKEHPGALHLGSQYFQLNRIPLTGWMMVAGATHAKEGAGAVPASIARMIEEHPLLRSIKNIDEAQQEARTIATSGLSEKAKTGTVSLAGKTLGRVIPSPVSLAAGLGDTQERDLRQGSTMNQLFAPMLNRIPGARNTLPAGVPRSRFSDVIPLAEQPRIPLKPRGKSQRIRF